MIIFIFLGFISSIFQLVVLREITFSIAKNELAACLAAGAWIIFSAIGGLVGRGRAVSVLPNHFLV